MERFLERHQSRVAGVLSGFDRILFRGTLRSMSRVTKGGRAYRPLRPIEVEEAKLFQSVLRGEHLLHGFRNRDIRELIAPGLSPRSTGARTLTGRITPRTGPAASTRADSQSSENNPVPNHTQGTSRDDHRA